MPVRASLPYSPARDRDEGLARSVDVGDIWRIFWCRRAWIFGVVAFLLAVAVVYDLVARSQYTATAQILIDPRDRQIVTKDVNPDTLAPDGGVLQVESQARVIESDAVLLRAIDAAGLASDPDYGAPSTSVFGKLLDKIMGVSTDANAARDKALRVLRRNLAVKRADKVFVVDVTVKASTGAKAAHISDAIADAYLADQVSARRESTRRASEALASRLQDLRDGVRDAENRVERYKATHDIVGTDKELVTDQQLDDSGMKLANARAKTAELRARIDQIAALRRSGIDPGAIPEALQSTVITQLRAAAQDLQRRASDLGTRVGARHPDLIAVTQQIREVKTQIAAELNRLEQGARSDYERARAYEHTLTLALDTSKQKTIATGQDSVELHELARELDARRSLYQAFLARSAETKAQADIDTSNARILSKAIPPIQPSWPPRALLVIGAIGAGLGLGAGLALVLEYCTPTILSVAQLRDLVEAPVLGSVSARAKARTRLLPPLATAARDDDTEIALALSRLCGPLAALRGVPETYSVLLTSTQADARARGEAVERVVAAAAERGIAVLLVEAALADAPFGAETAVKGFLDVLRGDCALGVAIQQHESGVKRLSIGTLSREAPEDLGAGGIERFLIEAGRYFDLIVFDGGAFERNLKMASLAARVDDVVMITVRGVTPRKAALGLANTVVAATGQPVSASLLLEQA